MVKRGMLVYVVLAIFLTLSFSSVAEVDGQGFYYEYGLGIGGVDDDAADGCEPDSENARLEFFSSAFSRSDGSGTFSLHYPQELFPGTFVQMQCEWNGLYLDEKGCYFFSSETDGVTDNSFRPTDDYYPPGDFPNDCAGWFVPEGSIVNGQRDSAYNRFFGALAAGEASASTDDFGDAMQNSFPNRLSTYEQGNPLVLGQITEADDYREFPGTNAICLFNQWTFNSPDTTFQCIQHEGEYRWYICDGNNLYETTGNYLKIPQCEENSDCTNPSYSQCQDNLCVNIEGLPESLPQAWFCTQNSDNEYVWSSESLTCADEGINCDEDKSICELDPNGYQWVETSEGNNCCGNDPDDFASYGTSSDGSGKRLCLSSSPERVGIAEGDIGASSLWTANCEAGKQWCWVRAFGEAKFHILTIKKSGQQPYDVVSNNNNWYECKESAGTRGINAPGATVDPADTANANRFYCYKEGNHWSWAECRPQEPIPSYQHGAKERVTGESLFSLPLSENHFVDLEQAYQSYYGDGGIDFVGENLALEFYVRFTSLDYRRLPAALNLKVYGPQQEGQDGQAGQALVYVNQDVLGFASNTPLLVLNRWIRVTVPIPELYDVSSIRLEAVPEVNQFEITNFHLVDPRQPQICSGQQSSLDDQSSWIQDLDYSSSTSEISGERICNALFDPNYRPASEGIVSAGAAWLGDFNEVDSATARCCGNNPQEYYAGQSTPVATTENIVGGTRYGCWNSEPIASGETTMNVEFEVEYIEKVPVPEYPLISFSYGYHEDSNSIHHCPEGRTSREITSCLGIPLCNGQLYATRGDSCLSGNCIIGDRCFNVQDSGDISCEEDGLFVDGRQVHLDSCVSIHHDGENLGSDTIDITTSPKILQPLTFDRDYFMARNLVEIEEVSPFLEHEMVDVYFTSVRDPSQHIDELQYDDISRYGSEFYLVAEVNSQYTITIEQTERAAQKTVIYTCSEETGECLYPLPGNSPYTITNSHPDLYELYFVSENGEESLITPVNNRFTTVGNIKAKKVAQQVLFVSEEEQAARFYGCQAAAFLETGLPEDFVEYENVPYCNVKAGKFCSFSVPHQGTSNDLRERFTTVNSWSDEQLTQLGYALNSGQSPFDSDPAEFLQNQQLRLRTTGLDLPVLPEQRNHSALILPGRNFISNAQFQTSGQELPHWDIFTSTGILALNQRSYVEGDSLVLAAGEKARSERLAVPQNAVLQFSQNGSCSAALIIRDKDGNPTGNAADLTAVETGVASYLIVEFSGACSMRQPMLQLLDDDNGFGAVPYSHVVTGLDDDARSGVACCQANYCWNGYACVAPMTELTSLAEHLPDGRNYRCIEGQWEYSPVKFDWNNDQWGFCASQEQCFVMSSTTGSAGAASTNTASGFYANQYPTCINNKEYIFDNYCQAGNWTSRTKFVATKLLSVAGDKYTLYCGDYRDMLVNFRNPGDKENFLGGEGFGQVAQQPELGEAITSQAQPQQIRTCFSLGPDGRLLVKEEDNSCINNVCVLKADDGRISFATTLNKNITDPNSFFLALNIPQSRLHEVCGGNGEFVHCSIADLQIPGDLWYSPELNAIVYGKNGIELTPGIIDRIVDWFRGIFAIEAASSMDQSFLRPLQFKDVYIQRTADKQVRAVKEISPGKIVAEFENFDTPVCDYLRHLDVPLQARTELLEQLSGQERVRCLAQNATQRVEIFNAFGFFWPQLTGKLRANYE